MARFQLLASLAGLVSACTATADAPSLVPRAIEARGDAEPVRTVAPEAPDLAFDAKLIARTQAFAVAEKAFAATLAAVEPRIRRGASAAIGSDAWLDAQAALTELGGARGASESALVDLEDLAISRAAAAAQPLEKLDAAIARAIAEIERQVAALARLEAISPS